MDPRLYNQLEERITEYGGELPNLGSLIADLEALWTAEKWDAGDQAEFRKQWEGLEQIYALAYDHNPPVMTPEGEEEVKDILERLRQVLPPPNQNSGTIG